jgi:hypothetical protein
MLKQKDVIQFRSLLKPGQEHELLLFIEKVWIPKGSADVVIRSVGQRQSLVLELIDDSGQNTWLLTNIKDTPLYKYLHAARGNYIRFVIPLEDAGWIKHKASDVVNRSQFHWISISDRVVYRRPIK